MSAPAGGRRRLAVLGSPIEHSKSPQLHAAAYRELGLDWDYGRAEVGESELAGFLDGLGPEWLGLSLTMPLKREALRLAELPTERATATGQANTLVRTAHGWVADNTDVPGLLDALADDGIRAVRTGIVLGGGATAVSAARALQSLGAEVTMAMRSPERAPLADVPAVALDSVRLETADVTISTVPASAELRLDVPALDDTRTLLDVVYDPWPSPLASAWTTAGGRVIDGLAMLLHQAVHQIRLFSSGADGDPDAGAPLPDEPGVLRVMRAAVGRS